jgi:hypothetical protein
MAERTLINKAFPNIDNELHKIAVKASDQLFWLYDKKILSPTEAHLMIELMNVLLLVRKNIRTKERDEDNSSNARDILTPGTENASSKNEPEAQ